MLEGLKMHFSDTPYSTYWMIKTRYWWRQMRSRERGRSVVCTDVCACFWMKNNPAVWRDLVFDCRALSGWAISIHLFYSWNVPHGKHKGGILQVSSVKNPYVRLPNSMKEKQQNRMRESLMENTFQKSLWWYFYEFFSWLRYHFYIVEMDGNEETSIIVPEKKSTTKVLLCYRCLTAWRGELINFCT